MSDKNNELQPADSASSEKLSRAERIRAIKDSIRTGSQQETADIKDTAPSAAAEKASSGTDADFDSEITEKIAKRVQKMKADKIKAAEKKPEEDTKKPEAEQNNVPEQEEKPEVSKAAPAQTDEAQHNETPAEEDASGKTDKAVSDEGKAEKPAKKKKSKKKRKKTFKDKVLDLFPRKKDKMSEKIRKVVFLGSCAAIVVCGSMVAHYYIDTITTQQDYDEIEKIYISDYEKDMPPEEPQDSEELAAEIYTMFDWAETLSEQNDELVGYITVPGSKDDPDADNEIAYPVVQSDDLEKYLDTSFTGETARAGTLFLDYRNRFDNAVNGLLTEQNSDNLIIYGHNMQDGNMFGKLKNYRNDSGYYEQHPIVRFDSIYKEYYYKIFAFFIIDASDVSETQFDCWNHINFANEDEFYDYVNEAKRRTIRLTNVDVEYGDKLLTLSTCNSIFGNDGPGRLIVMARLVREGEDLYEGTEGSTENPNIKWPSLYYKYNDDKKYDPDAEFIPYGESVAEETTNTEE